MRMILLILAMALLLAGFTCTGHAEMMFTCTCKGTNFAPNMPIGTGPCGHGFLSANVGAVVTNVRFSSLSSYLDSAGVWSLGHEPDKPVYCPTSGWECQR
jgi:hypothetical protein